MNGWLPDIDFGGIGYLDEDAYKGMLEQVKDEVHSLFDKLISVFDCLHWQSFLCVFRMIISPCGQCL